jgi:CBS-domain-containing membrane protein
MRRVLSQATLTTPHASALSLFQNSCYHKIDFKINGEYTVHQAVQKLTEFNIGCLAVTNQHNRVVGILSERDYIHKVSLVGKDARMLRIKDVCTHAPNMIVTPHDSVEQCMKKMLVKDSRHLLVVDEKSNECVGLISMKDVVKELMRNKNEVITRLSDFKTGRGGFFGSE